MKQPLKSTRLSAATVLSVIQLLVTPHRSYVYMSICVLIECQKKKGSLLTNGLSNNILGASQDSQQFFWREKGEETSEPALSLL